MVRKTLIFAPNTKNAIEQVQNTLNEMGIHASDIRFFAETEASFNVQFATFNETHTYTFVATFLDEKMSEWEISNILINSGRILTSKIQGELK